MITAFIIEEDVTETGSLTTQWGTPMVYKKLSRAAKELGFSHTIIHTRFTRAKDSGKPQTTEVQAEEGIFRITRALFKE